MYLIYACVARSRHQDAFLFLLPYMKGKVIDHVCLSEELRKIARNEVRNDTQSLLQESVTSLLHYSCGGTTG